MRLSRRAHFGRVRVVYAVVMRLSVFRKNLFYFGIEVIAVHFQRLFGHSDAAERLQRALERFIRLQAHNLFQIFIEIPRPVRRKRRHYRGIGV